ncbi:hypothetical protein [Streptomyces gobitricini]|uniref:hypothetical protein n=1 Tax=Streptomyces gobitricini TaxID=68211 RepID=UPI0031DAAAAF
MSQRSTSSPRPVRRALAAAVVTVTLLGAAGQLAPTAQAQAPCPRLTTPAGDHP